MPISFLTCPLFDTLLSDFFLPTCATPFDLFLFLCTLSVAVGYLWTYFQETVLLKEWRLSESGLFT